ncbi:MAG TPA: hypothetical protein VGZ73_25170 [Bryobacteraceae bacterium]|nr:hypothetical protein [Bryobacteraceae bacterium]
MKFEQASKAAMWAPTRQMNGEGQADRENPARERANAMTIVNRSGPPE